MPCGPAPPAIDSVSTTAFRFGVTRSTAACVSLDGSAVFVAPPPERECVQFTVLFSAANVQVVNWPGRRSMKSTLVGATKLANAEGLWAVAHTFRPDAEFVEKMDAVRYGMRVTHADGSPLEENFGATLVGTEDDRSAWFLDIALDNQGNIRGHAERDALNHAARGANPLQRSPMRA